MKSTADTYFRVKEEKRAYMGDRYFKFNMQTLQVIQVCAGVGEVVKKGKSNAIGVYVIHQLTFLSNYFGMGYTEPCTKKEYDKKFNEVVKMLGGDR